METAGVASEHEATRGDLRTKHGRGHRRGEGGHQHGDVSGCMSWVPSKLASRIGGRTMRARAFPLALLVLGLAAPAALAQYSNDPGQEGGGHRGRMYGMGRGTPPDPVIFKGPPAPADFQKLVQLPDAKLASYQSLYDHLMTDTKPQRDSLAA